MLPADALASAEISGPAWAGQGPPLHGDGSLQERTDRLAHPVDVINRADAQHAGGL
jgi:hypothetical protein